MNKVEKAYKEEAFHYIENMLLNAENAFIDYPYLAQVAIEAKKEIAEIKICLLGL